MQAKVNTYQTLLDVFKDNDLLSTKGIRFISSLTEETYLTYQELYNSALEMLHHLQNRGINLGDEVVLQLENLQDFVVTFWACLLGGIIPVPVAVGRNHDHRAKLMKIWAVLQNPYLATTVKTYHRLDNFINQTNISDISQEITARSILIDSLPVTGVHGVEYSPEPQDIAFLQFSSGATGDPKGVTLTHEALLTNIRAMISTIGYREDDLFLSWVPLTHDMGLVGWHLTPLFVTAGQNLIPPEEFIKDPFIWFEAVHRHRATVLASPNFGYRYFLRLYSAARSGHWDLSCIRFIFNAAEPVSAALCREFIATMAPHGIRPEMMTPTYGMAEACLCVTVASLDETVHSVQLKRNVMSIGQPVVKDPAGGEFVDVGRPVAEMEVQIRDEEGNSLADGVIGLIHIRGKSVTQGYYNNPQATAAAISVDGWLNTGDLGFIEEGRLFITGRMKDIIFVNGQNYYPHDLEGVAEELEGISLNQVVFCGVSDEESGSDMILCFILDFSEPAEFVPRIFEVKRQISKVTGLDVRRVLPVRRIPKTTSGKIQRYRLGEMYLEGHFDELCAELDQAMAVYLAERGVVLPESQLEAELVQIATEFFKVPTLSVTDDLFTFGINSLKATALVLKIEERLGLHTTLREVLTHPTIRELAQCLSTALESGTRTIERAPEAAYNPLSSAQKRLFIVSQLGEGHEVYNIPGTILIEGHLERTRLEQVMQQIVQRHESFRTAFQLIDGEPMQKVYPQVDFTLEYREITPEMLQTEITATIQPFNLAEVPLFRAKLIKFGEDRHLLVFDMHHIISDGTSINILIQEISDLYEGKELPALEIQYKDYAVWQQEFCQTPEFYAQEAFWLDLLGGEIPTLNLPVDYVRPEVLSYRGDAVKVRLNEELTSRLQAMCSQNGVTLFIFLLSAYNILLSKYTGQKDLLVGTTIAGRGHTRVQNLIGMFVNMLVLRNQIDPEKSFLDLLPTVKEQALQAYTNQDYPYDRLVQKLGIKRKSNQPQLLDTVITLPVTNFLGAKLGELEFKPYDYQQISAQYDLVLHAFETGPELLFQFDYSVDLFKRETIQHLAQHYLNLIEEILLHPEMPTGMLDMFSAAEKEEVIFGLNATACAELTEKTVCTLLEEQVDKTPEQIAISCGQEHLTYQTFNAQVNQFARQLQKRGVKQGDIVAILAEPSIETVIAIWGIVKVGATYLPIDPAYPEHRVLALLKDSDAALLLTQEKDLHRLSYLTLMDFKRSTLRPVVTETRPQILNFDSLPIVDRTLVDYHKYHQYIGEALVKHSISLQATRGCPYNCAYCHKIWPKRHVVRSAENIFEEVSMYYKVGIRRFVFLDDIFNLNVANSERFFRMVIEEGLKIQIFFPNGLRGDILTKEYIDLMIEAGVVQISLALETASPRLQKMIGKNLQIEKLKENFEYITANYPDVILDCFFMVGFPTETEEEALATLEFIKSVKWLHFPSVSIVKIFPNTEMEKIALENGITKEQIERGMEKGFSEVTETSTLSQAFLREYQSTIFNDYFLSKERLLHVLRVQMKILTRDEIVQKYNSYLPFTVTNFSDLLNFLNISRKELGQGSFVDEATVAVPDFNQQIKGYFRENQPAADAPRVLLLDLSQSFSTEASRVVEPLVEAPLGLLYLLSYLNVQLPDQIHGKIAKSKIDFDSYAEFANLLAEFKPDLIGIRTLSIYSEFFHRAVAFIRDSGFSGPIISGGPYASSSYETILKDPNVDIVIRGEGEITFVEFIRAFIAAGKQLPPVDVLQQIPGLAFIADKARYGSSEFTRKICILEEISSKLPKEDSTNLNTPLTPEDVPYIIYTSGSTGQPKGVMVKHRGLTNYLTWAKKTYLRGEDEVVPLYSSLSFDLTVTSLYLPLISGNRLLVYAGEERALVLERILQDNQVTLMKLTPSHLKVLKELDVKSSKLRTLIVGGEDLRTELARTIHDQFAGTVAIYNEYGPTETVVGCMIYQYNPETDHSLSVPIGKAIDNTAIYLLDQERQPVGYGIPGEIYIGGAGVARGYLNREALTQERFVENPFMPGTTMYKTGDLARRMPEGDLIFLGRLDDQVKIRGYRIEPAEIEQHLLKYYRLKEAVVCVREDLSSNKVLAAYLIPKESVTVEEVRVYLSKRVPDYMIPAHIIMVETIPLTANGKVDLKTLPDPYQVQEGSSDLTPATSVERALLSIWRDVLGAQKISLEDNFFELAGDSIKAIQIIARANQRGIHISVKDIFAHKTIKELVANVNLTREKILAEQTEVVGDVLLTPVQNWFFYENSATYKHYWNQLNLFTLRTGVDLELLEQALRKLLAHHDALRMGYQFEGEEVYQFNRGLDDVEFALQIVDLRNVRYEVQQTRLKEISEKLQDELDLEYDLLFKAVVFDLGERGQQLLLVLHHLIVDGVSWRILLEDLETLYESGLSDDLPLKTTSFKDWSERINQVALESLELSYWENLDSNQLDSLTTVPPATDLVEDYATSVLAYLPAEETGVLLKNVHQAYNTEINDILLAALGLALAETSEIEKYLITLEAHGREEIFEDIDLSRTVGWFTATYPVYMELTLHPVDMIIQVKENLRKIPQHGIYFGIARHLQRNARLQRLNPEIAFNYLGQFETGFAYKHLIGEIPGLESSALLEAAAGTEASSKLLSPSAEDPGRFVHQKNRLSHLLEINGVVLQGQLFLLLNYNTSVISSEFVQAFSTAYTRRLRELIHHCTTQAARTYTASDFGLQNLLDSEDFAILGKQFDISDIQLMPLTPMQEGMLFYNILSQAGNNYYEQVGFSLSGTVNVTLLKEAWQQVINRYDILRSCIVWKQLKRMVQVILPARTAEITIYDLSGFSADHAKTKLAQIKDEDLERRFDFEQGQMNRLSIIQLQPEEYYLCWTFHHALLDGWSTQIVLQDFMTIYHSLERGVALPPKPAAQFSDYLHWLQKKDLQTGLDFWRNNLRELTTLTLVAGDYQKPAGQIVERIELLTMNLNQHETDQFTQFCARANVTLNALFQTAWSILLQKECNRTVSCAGMTVSGRQTRLPHVEEIVGLLINSVPVVIKSEMDDTLSSLLEKVNQQLVELREYEYVSLVEIKKVAPLGQSEELFNTILAFENYPAHLLGDICNLDTSKFSMQIDHLYEMSNYDLAVVIVARPTIHVRLIYNADLFKPETIERLRNTYQEILRMIVNKPEQLLSELNLLSQADYEEFVYTFNQTAAPYPAERTIHALFEEQVEKTPEALAIAAGTVEFTYGQLNETANRLAHYLQTRGVAIGKLVGISLKHSPATVIGILAILKAGGAYVPVDPGYPFDRIAELVEDSGISLLLTSEDLVSHFSATGVTVLAIDQLTANLCDYSAENCAALNTPTDLAYIIYTSGSTGRPKGVMIEHQSLVNYVTWAARVYLEGQTMAFPLYSSLSFDLTVTSIFVPLITGSPLIIFAADDHGLLIEKVIQDHRVQVLKLTPSHLKIVKELDLRDSNLQCLIVGGEELRTDLAGEIYCKFDGAIRIYNEYGPTEATVGCMIYRFEPENCHLSSVPIGRPAQNVQIYLLDQDQHPVGYGVPGEIYISGDGVARGYLNRSELTLEKFVENPFVPGTHMYRTGDLGKRLQDGNLVFLGRMDQQLKIRGYRIEPAEIEKHLLHLPGVKEALVLDQEDGGGNKYLVAYLVTGDTLDREAPRSALAGKLPEYMIPAYFLQVPQIPLTANGKVDRKALPLPEVARSGSVKEPTSQVEATLLTIWENVLGIRNISLNDNFFELAGDSIKAIQIIARANQKGIQIGLKDIFTYKTIADLVANVDLAAPGSAAFQGEVEGEVPLTPVQNWFFALQAGEPQYWNQTYLFTLAQDVDLERLERAFERVIEHHDALRMQYFFEGGEIIQYNRPVNEVDFRFTYVDLAEEPAEVQAAKLRATSEEIQTRRNLEEDLLIQAIVIDLGSNGKRLLVPVHHLVIDSVSWRILLEDIMTLYNSNLKAELPKKTTSFKDWSTRLHLHASVTSLDTGYWDAILPESVPSLLTQTASSLPQTSAMYMLQDFRNITLEFTKEWTAQLLHDAGWAYQTEINDLLLAALTLALSKAANLESIMVNLEGHGREEIIPGMNLTRTMGWFTSLYPVYFKAQPTLEKTIIHVKESLRRVPDKGINFGIARYLQGQQRLEQLNPEISFNYLGRFDQEFSAEGQVLSAASEDYGPIIHGANPLPYLININGMVEAGQLRFMLGYQSEFISAELAQSLGDHFRASLEELVQHCLSVGKQTLTASDYQAESEFDDEDDFARLLDDYDV